MCAFRNSREAERDRGRSARGGGIRKVTRESAGGGYGASGVAGGKRLFMLVLRTARIGFVTALVEQDMRAGAADKTFYQALTEICRRDGSKHRERAVGHTPVA